MLKVGGAPPGGLPLPVFERLFGCIQRVFLSKKVAKMCQRLEDC
jgi:hypothetical protein